MLVSEKLQKVVLRDTGISIDLPISINRGYWHTGDCFRWQAKEIGGKRMFYSYDSMSACVRLGVAPIPRKPPQDWWGEWYFDADEERQSER